MNHSQKEITKLHEQVSHLYTVIKQLSEYVGWQDVKNHHLPLDTASLIQRSQSVQPHSYSASNSESVKKNNSEENYYLLNQHKDILVDDESVQTLSVSDNNSSQRSEVISCDEQVHRLTAQLTAAYYRIASLEEQLLAIRNRVESSNNGFYQCQ